MLLLSGTFGCACHSEVLQREAVDPHASYRSDHVGKKLKCMRMSGLMRWAIKREIFLVEEGSGTVR